MADRRKKKKKKSGRALVVALLFLIVAALGLIGTGVYFLFFKNKDAYERQNTEKSLADEYIDDMILKFTDPSAYEEKMARAAREKAARMRSRAAEEGSSEAESADGTDRFADLDYDDPNYYMRDGIVYTPDYAKGYIDCVLEVPTAGIRRGVYTGTWDEIAYDLDIWMVTAGRPDYVLGETHYCIYGHNHTAQNLSFNRLKDVQEGEFFYLTAESGRYTYEITKVYALTRENATSELVDNFNIPADKCYIITCGRDDGVRNYRYLDLVVEGTLREHMSLEEYAKLRGQE